jgi:hypothetical protein
VAAHRPIVRREETARGAGLRVGGCLAHRAEGEFSGREFVMKDIDDPLLYDMVINTDRVSYREAARLIAEAVSLIAEAVFTGRSAANSATAEKLVGRSLG